MVINQCNNVVDYWLNCELAIKSNSANTIDKIWKLLALPCYSNIARYFGVCGQYELRTMVLHTSVCCSK